MSQAEDDLHSDLLKSRAELAEQQANTIKLLLDANELHLKTIQSQQETIERLLRLVDRPPTLIPYTPAYPPYPLTQPYYTSPVMCFGGTPTDGSGATVSNRTP
jgi:hypothetical protein